MQATHLQLVMMLILYIIYTLIVNKFHSKNLRMTLCIEMEVLDLSQSMHVQLFHF